MDKGDRIVVGLDPGFGAGKMWSDGVGGVVVPSCVVPYTGHTVTTMGGGLRVARPPHLVEFSGRTWVVGERAFDWGEPVGALDMDRLTDTPDLRALIYALLSHLWDKREDEGPLRAFLVVGLPVAVFTQEGRRIRRSVTRFLLGEHRWACNGRERFLLVERVMVTSQTAGALFDYFLDLDGRSYPARRKVFGQEVGVMNVGLNTLDLQVVRKGTVIPGRTVGEQLGARTVLTYLADRNYTIRELDHMLRTDSLPPDLKERLNAAVENWSRRVSGVLDQYWQRSGRYALTIVVGGGVFLLRRYLDRMIAGEIHIPDDPVLTTARGLYKIGRRAAAKAKEREGR